MKLFLEKIVIWANLFLLGVLVVGVVLRFIGFDLRPFLKENRKVEIVWWGVMSFEVRFKDKIIQLDPFFRFYRPANYVLCTNQFSDHCNQDAIDRIQTVSGDRLQRVFTPKNVLLKTKAQPLQKEMSAKETYQLDSLYVHALYGFEALPEDLAFYFEIDGLRFFHMGDANNPSFTDLEQFFKARKEGIDFFLATLGKMDIPLIQKLVKIAKPKYLIPGHYPHLIYDIEEGAPLKEFPDERAPYLRPNYTVAHFVERMQEYIKSNNLPTRIVVFNPGMPIHFDD